MESSRPQPLRVAFYVPNAYPLLLTPDSQGRGLRAGRWFAPNIGYQPFGGIETRALTIARALASHAGVEVGVIVENPAALTKATHDRMTIHGRPNFRQQARRNLRTRSWTQPQNWWRWATTSVGRLFAGATVADDTPDQYFVDLGYDTIVTFGANRQSLSAIRSVTRSVLCIAADAEVSSDIANGISTTTAYGEPASVVAAAIKEATLIVAQTHEQQRSLQESFGRDSVLIPNPIDLKAWNSQINSSSPVRKPCSALWVGRADRDHKRPLLALEVARQTPSWSWTMVLNPRDPDVENEVVRTLPSNVTLIPSVPFTDMPALMASHAVFVSTSDPSQEGFPNVLLQAAASGTPILSFGAGRTFLERSGAGQCVSSVDELCSAISTIEPGVAVADYLTRHHDATAVANQLDAVLRSVST